MDTEMVVPSQLHRELECAKDSGDERTAILQKTLRSGNLAVIRRIPELLSPLSDEEKELVAQWGDRLTEREDISDRDFAFHFMANCDVPAERILGILERNNTYSRSALEHIQQALRASKGAQGSLDDYLGDVAETLLRDSNVSPRDRGRHMLMTLAGSEEDWLHLAERFTGPEIIDLRQRVIERFLRECPDGEALTMFVDKVVEMCIASVENAHEEDVHSKASHMHWILMCLERTGQTNELSRAASLFRRKFGNALPRSLQHKIDNRFPRRSVADARRKKAQEPTETNAQIAARLGISKRQVAKLRAKGEIPN